jgi:hypothetical protein
VQDVCARVGDALGVLPSPVDEVGDQRPVGEQTAGGEDIDAIGRATGSSRRLRQRML